MRIYSKTHKGYVRSNNQDALLINVNAYGVADGMGGHQGGETASSAAVQVVTAALQGKTPNAKTLKTALDAANRRIFMMGRDDSTLFGMGTTFTMLWEAPDAMWIAHVGDSRAYLCRDGELICKTEDHSMIAELLKNNLITKEAAKTHPYKNVITRAVGIDPAVDIDILQAEKKVGDIWLICSDGLYNMVRDEQIAEVLMNLHGEAAAEKLLELALENGGADNISFVLGVVTEAAEA